jgi:aminoglycoside N3'-acetyltransferase
MYSSQELTDGLFKSGIQQGDVFLFEAPTIRPEEWEGGFQSLLKSLQFLAGPTGTLIVPTCTHHEGYPKPVFDPDLSPSECGEFSEFFRCQPGVSRSHNPTHSVSGWGPATDTILNKHRSAFGRPSPWGDGSLGINSPYDVLFDLNAWWVMFDTNLADDPFIHYVQAVFSQKNRGVTRRTPFVGFNPEKLFNHLEKAGIVKTITFHACQVRLLRVKDCVSYTIQFLQDHLVEIDPTPETAAWLRAKSIIHNSGYLQAGAARIKITPPVPCNRWEGKILTGVYRDLYARAIVFNHNGYKTALVVCDLLGISASLVAQIRSQAHELTGIQPEKIQIACTHSHSTPDTVGAGFEDSAYLVYMVEQVAKGIQEADQRLQPVRIGNIKVPIRGIAHSRRQKLKDGTVYTTRYGVPSTWRVKPELIDSEGTIDPELRIVRIESLDGTLLAGISNFACHAAVALMSSNLSGDFPGEAMAILETVMEKDSVFLCTNGAAANVDATLEVPYWGPRSDKSARHIGVLFAAQVMETLERIECVDDALLEAVQEKVDLPVREDWIELIEHQQERIQTEISKGWKLNSSILEIARSKVIHTEVQALRLNDMVMVSLPGEVFTEAGLALKQAHPQVGIAVVELANDNIGYIPTHQAFAEGGYEVACNLWGRVTPEAADRLMEAAHTLIQTVCSPTVETFETRS